MEDLCGLGMDKFSVDWESYELTVESDRGPLDLKWSNVEDLAKYATLQSGLFGVNRPYSKQVFFETFPKFYQGMWNLTHSMGGFDLPENAVVVDIGSGVGIMDLLLAAYLKNPSIHLIDKQELNNKPGVYFSKDYFFYNSWNPTLDCINKTPNIKDKIFFKDPTDNWPEEVDCVTSYFSWCMHYPKEVYWDKIKQTLKPGGKLIVDVRKLKDRDIIEEISEEFKSIPKLHRYEHTVVKWIDDNQDSTLGHRCVWTRNNNAI